MSPKAIKKLVLQTALKFLCRGALMLVCGQSALAGQSVSLSWNPSADTNAVGYRIYYGGASLAYTNSITVGNVTNAVVSGLVAGATYYFGATTVGASGNESDLSNEASYVIPATTNSASAPMLGSVAQNKGSFQFVVSGTSGVQYVVEASTDLVHWTAVQTNLAPFTFVDTNAAGFSRRFYRSYYKNP